MWRCRRRRPLTGDRRGAGGAGALPPHRARCLLPAAGGPRRDRLASAARRPHRRRGRGPRPEQAPRGASLRRPRPLHDDRPPPEARHGLCSGGVAGEPADPAGGPRSDSRLPLASPGGGPGDGRDAGGRLRPAADRADRLPPPPAVRRPPRGGEPAQLSRLGELAADWVRREPTGSNRDFVRYLVAVSEAGVAPVDEQSARWPTRSASCRSSGRRVSSSRGCTSSDFRPGAVPPPPARRWCRRRSAAPPPHEVEARRLLYMAMTRATDELVLAARRDRVGQRPTLPFYEDARRPRCRRAGAGGGALRSRRGNAGDLPDDPGRGARGGLARRRQAPRAEARHLRRCHPGGCPLPRAGQARRPDPGLAGGAGRRRPRGHQRPADQAISPEQRGARRPASTRTSTRRAPRSAGAS